MGLIFVLIRQEQALVGLPALTPPLLPQCDRRQKGRIWAKAA